MTIRTMVIEDYEALYKLWKGIEGFGIRSIDDSKEGIETFLKRNPSTSAVAINEDGNLIGSILCGHDGRTGNFYHVCVQKEYRRQGIGKAMANFCMQALENEHVNKVALIVFTKNKGGNAFWKQIGWSEVDCNYYEFPLNEENITRFNRI